MRLEAKRGESLICCIAVSFKRNQQYILNSSRENLNILTQKSLRKESNNKLEDGLTNGRADKVSYRVASLIKKIIKLNYSWFSFSSLFLISSFSFSIRAASSAFSLQKNNSYLSHRVIDSLPRNLKWKIIRLKSVLLAPSGRRPGLTKVVLFLWFLF